MNEILKVIISLAIVTMLSGFIVSFAHSSTAKMIETQQEHMQLGIVEKAFADDCNITEAAGSYPQPPNYWIGKKDSIICGYAFIVETKGYSGTVKFVIGVDTAGTITGLSMVSESETPARGKRMEELILNKKPGNGHSRKNNNVQPWFSEQFKGINISRPLSINTKAEWHELSDTEKKELVDSNAISAVSGATISSKAVVDGITKTALTYFNAVKGNR